MEEIECPNCNGLLRIEPPGEVRCWECGMDVVVEWIDGELYATATIRER